MKNLSFLIVLLILFTCTTKEKYNKDEVKKEFEKFPNSVRLNGKKTNTQNFRSMEIVGIIDSLLIISSSLDKYEFYIFNKNNFNLITKEGKTGKGPKELTAAVNGNINKKSGYIYTGDRSKLKIFKFNIDSMLNKKNYLPSEYVNLPKNFANASQIRVVNDSLIFGLGMREYSAVIINEKGEIIDTIGQIPNKPENINSNMHRNLYMKFMTYNNNQKKFAISYFNFDKLNVYKLNGKRIFKIYGPDFIKTSYNDIKSPGAPRTAYWNMYSDNNYIYGLYSGKKGYEKDNSSFNGIKQNHPKKIFIYDWQGKPKLKVVLDRESVDFTIDKNSNRLIAVSFKDRTLVVYNLKKIKKALSNL